MNTKYLTGITLVATLGGFLFGFDTAVVNGAEKSLVDYYISKALDPVNYDYARILITQYRLLVASVFILIFIVISGQLIRLLGLKRGVISGLVLLIPLLVFIITYLGLKVPEPEDTSAIRDLTDSIKGFVVSSAIVGCIIGAAISGFIAKSVGRKKGLILTSVLLTISAFGAWQPELLNLLGTLDAFSYPFCHQCI
jgi:SP family xylose:H+ symportor-like MFS transporter